MVEIFQLPTATGLVTFISLLITDLINRLVYELYVKVNSLSVAELRPQSLYSGYICVPSYFAPVCPP